MTMATIEIFMDLETRPCDDADLLARIAANVRPPATMKRHDTIAKWEAEERPAAVAEAISRTGLDGKYGRVCCIGWAINDEEPRALVGADEREIIKAWFAEISDVLRPKDSDQQWEIFIGHNIAGFDLPFLRKRCMVLGLIPPPELLMAMRAKPWSDDIADTMLIWDHDRDKRIGLDELCLVLGIPSPKVDGMDGSKVAELFADGAYDEIGNYCCGDITATRRCYRAMNLERIAA